MSDGTTTTAGVPAGAAGPTDPAPAGRTAMTALVANPVKVGDLGLLRGRVTARCHELGLPPLSVYETRADEPGVEAAREAVAHGATLVLAAGGDGTIRAVAEGLVGTGVPLGLLPQGTGNLLARNLGVPVGTDEALEIALTGMDRAVDVGRLEVEKPPPRYPEDTSELTAEKDAETGTIFTVMAGAGFDAAMMREAPEGLKNRIGWPAYLVGGVRGLRRQRIKVELRLDDDAPRTARVRTVLIGNVGQLQGGLELLPDAKPDDGLLDVALVTPRRPLDWAVLVGRAALRRHRTDHRLRTYQAREVTVRLVGVHPRQVDGDLIADGSTLHAHVEPRALVVRVPREQEGS